MATKAVHNMAVGAVLGLFGDNGKLLEAEEANRTCHEPEEGGGKGKWKSRVEMRKRESARVSGIIRGVSLLAFQKDEVLSIVPVCAPARR